MNLTPLHNLQQLLYDPRGARYLVLSRAHHHTWQLSMWTSEEPAPANPRVWRGVGDTVGDTVDAAHVRSIADAIVAGMMSVQPRDNGGLKLTIHLPRTAVSVYLDAADAAHPGSVGDLLAAAFIMKEAKPADEASSARDAQVAALEAQIASMQSRNADLHARLQRQSGSSGRKDVQPIVKPVAPPRNASVLQPTQRKRTVVEDEFMSSEEEEDDDSEEEYGEDD